MYLRLVFTLCRYLLKIKGYINGLKIYNINSLWRTEKYILQVKTRCDPETNVFCKYIHAWLASRVIMNLFKGLTNYQVLNEYVFFLKMIWQWKGRDGLCNFFLLFSKYFKFLPQMHIIVFALQFFTQIKFVLYIYPVLWLVLDFQKQRTVPRITLKKHSFGERKHKTKTLVHSAIRGALHGLDFLCPLILDSWPL